MSNHELAITRVANACVLIELNGYTILTDPWFTERWYLRCGEPLGLKVADLAPLTAIVATSFAANHWNLRALREYRHKSGTPVYVSTARMVRQARALGYPLAERMCWDETREPAPTLSIEAVSAGKTMVWPNNAYVLSSGQPWIFFGGEIEDVAFLERRGPVTVALLPTNGLRPVVGPPLVMGPREAVAGARVLGAHALVPVHDADPDHQRVASRPDLVAGSTSGCGSGTSARPQTWPSSPRRRAHLLGLGLRRPWPAGPVRPRPCRIRARSPLAPCGSERQLVAFTRPEGRLVLQNGAPYRLFVGGRPPRALETWFIDRPTWNDLLSWLPPRKQWRPPASSVESGVGKRGRRTHLV